ncbi:MAG: PQQ-dependent sugar dehydrogenase [Bacteroidota bacterium]
MKHLTLYLIFTLFTLISMAQLPLPIDTITVGGTQIEVRIVAQNRVIPWDLAWASDGWLWFSERNGNVIRTRPENGYIEQVFHIEESFESPENSGLHALALHPNFPETPYIYVHFTYTWDASRVVRYTFDEANLTLTDRFVIQDSIWGSSSHNGSRIVFSPEGDKMFVAMGDGYQAERAQDYNDLNGAILRYNLDGSIPEDNPFPGSAVWSYGHRNPQGLVFGTNGLLYSTEHGTSNHDEINVIEKGRNYGWPIVEGICNTPPEEFLCEQENIRAPIYDYEWTWAVCGMAYYDHPAIPEWRNKLLVTSLKGGDGASGQRLQLFHLKSTGIVVDSVWDYFANTFGRLRDVMTTPDGRIFFCTSNQEINGDNVRKPNDDVIVELRNVELDYSTPPVGQNPIDFMQLGPIPALDVLYLRLPFYKGLAQLELTDLRGTKVWASEVEFFGARVPIEKGEFGPGLYWLRIELEDGSSAIRKVIFN